MSNVAIEVLQSRMEKGTIKKRVAEVCARKPQCKGNYRLLCYYYLKFFEGVKLPYSEFEKILKGPTFGSIERRYRELKSEDELLSIQEGRVNKYEPGTGTKQKRWNNETVYHDYYSRQAGLRDYEEIT